MSVKTSAAKKLTENKTTPKVDPLYVIFEQHLFNFQDSDADRNTFISNVVNEYVGYLRKLNIAIPKSLEGAISEELAAQVSVMLTKKIYGCVNITEFRKASPVAHKKKARAKYSRLKASP